MKKSIAILAGGLGTRLNPVTLDIPKSMVKVKDVPFIEWQLKLLQSSGVDSVVLCLGYKSQEIIDFVGNGAKYGLEVKYSVEQSPLGTGGALKQAEPLLDDTFGVIYGDSYLMINYRDVFNEFKSSNKLALMTIFENNGRFDTSNVMMDQNGYLKYSKKSLDPKMKYIDFGFSILRKEALFGIKQGVRLDLADLLEELSLKDQIEAYEVTQRFYEVGSFQGIVELQAYLESE